MSSATAKGTTSGPAVPVPLLRPARDLRVVPEEDWDGVLERLGALELYTCRSYLEASTQLESPGSRPTVLHYRDDAGELALPLLLRPLPAGDGWDATSAYGYGGPVALGQPDTTAFGTALDSWARENGVVTSFLRLNPLLGNGNLLPPSAERIRLGSTVAWETPAGRDLMAGMHAKHRHSAKRADRAGIEFSVVPQPDDLDEFRALYVTTMRRQHADDFYYFPDAYWKALLVGDSVLAPLLVEARSDGELIAGVLLLGSTRWLHVHLAGSADVARSLGATHRCYLTAAQWAQAHGMAGLHLGGGIGGSEQDSLYAFKRRFDPAGEPRAFEIAKMVHDPERYRQLAGSDSTDGFFPPWRAPA
ncbi:GNAT family N-acetyltransferase [Blastococcus sp. URHD0036]|uniref:GNAT family N-acetyltransferase n=1 Tax=Blastococcus sp. URHD0036 TaxID=1380356 RepID=UPI00068956BB|nr:GNAT family N-acetyltransferase [Blastococcus sp. URHD0036]